MPTRSTPVDLVLSRPLLKGTNQARMPGQRYESSRVSPQGGSENRIIKAVLCRSAFLNSSARFSQFRAETASFLISTLPSFTIARDLHTSTR